MILRFILLWLLAASAVPGYRPVALGNGANMGQASAWGGLWPDINGYYNFHRRVYDPVTSHWLSGDPEWNEFDPNYMTFNGGDPANHGDWNGMLAAATGNYLVGLDQGFAQGFFGINTGQPTDTPNYNGQAEGRNLAGLVSVWMMYSGPQITDGGMGIMAGSATVEVDSVGTATIGAGPAFVGGAGSALFGTATTAAGGFGFNHFVNLTPLQSPSGDSGGGRSSAQDSTSGQQNPTTDESAPQGETPTTPATVPATDGILFRGGNSLAARIGQDVKPAADGLIYPLGKNGKPQGLSINLDPNDPFIQKYGGAFTVESLPEGLQALQSGRPGHFVIAPVTPMTFENYQQLLNQVQLGTFNAIP